MPDPDPSQIDPGSTRVTPWRDILLIALITVIFAVFAAYTNLSEKLFSVTRALESLQLDELPISMLVLSVGLMWLSWRRTRELTVQLQARRQAETRLAEALRDNRAFGQQYLRAVEGERRHLARELHDELGQYLNAIKIDAVALRAGPALDATASSAACERIVQTCDHVHGVVNDMIRRLRPVGLDDLGLSAAIESCVDHWRARLPATDFALTISGNVDALDESLSLTAYRLVQEALTNCSKHASARHVEIALSRQSADQVSRDALVVHVTDDGVGTNPAAPQLGFGLVGLRERVEMMGGRLGVDSVPGQGFSLEARLPVIA